MISSGSETMDQSRSFSYGESSWTTCPFPRSSHQPSHGSECACSARWETAVRWPWCSKYSCSSPPSTTRLGAGTLPLRHRQHDVIVERLGPALDEQVVGGQPRAADPEAAAADDVLDVVGDALLALGLRDRLQVGAVGGEHLLALVVLEPAHPGPVREPPLVARQRGGRLEQVEPRLPARLVEEFVQQAVRRREREAELVVAVARRERAHLLDVGP